MNNKYEFVDKSRQIFEEAYRIFLSKLNNDYFYSPLYDIYEDIGERMFNALNQAVDNMEEELSDTNEE